MSRTVHSDALKVGVDGGEQTGDFYLAAPAKDVEGPGTVFSAAPGAKDFSFQSG